MKILPNFVDEVLTDSTDTKKVLIAVDFKNYAEKIANYTLNFLKGIPVEFTFFHSLESNLSRVEAEEKMTILLQNLNDDIYNKPYFTFESIIFDANTVSGIEILNDISKFNIIAIGSSNDCNSRALGKTAKNIFLDISSNLLIIPPQAEIKTIKNVSILAEESLENMPFMNLFRRYLKCKDAFVNLIVCKENQKYGEADKSLIQSYQRFFNNNYVFSSIYECDDLGEVICGTIPKLDVDFFGLCWDENTKFFQYLLDKDFEKIPSFLKTPIIVSKEKQFSETMKIMKEIYV